MKYRIGDRVAHTTNPAEEECFVIVGIGDMDLGLGLKIPIFRCTQFTGRTHREFYFFQSELEHWPSDPDTFGDDK